MPPVLDSTKHTQLNNFINAISARDTTTLASHFSLSQKIISEIYDLIPTYFSTNSKLSAPPNTQSTYKTNIPLITIYDTGDGDIAVECFIFENNEPSEAILHVSFFAHSPDKLIYEFIDS